MNRPDIMFTDCLLMYESNSVYSFLTPPTPAPQSEIKMLRVNYAGKRRREKEKPSYF
jgi:hypothetical protein